MRQLRFKIYYNVARVIYLLLCIDWLRGVTGCSLVLIHHTINGLVWMRPRLVMFPTWVLCISLSTGSQPIPRGHSNTHKFPLAAVLLIIKCIICAVCESSNVVITAWPDPGHFENVMILPLRELRNCLIDYWFSHNIVFNWTTGALFMQPYKCIQIITFYMKKNVITGNKHCRVNYKNGV